MAYTYKSVTRHTNRTWFEKKCSPGGRKYDLNRVQVENVSFGSIPHKNNIVNDINKDGREQTTKDAQKTFVVYCGTGVSPVKAVPRARRPCHVLNATFISLASQVVYPRLVQLVYDLATSGEETNHSSQKFRIPLEHGLPSLFRRNP